VNRYREARLGYQPSLDGLRAVAVSLVVLDHAAIAPFVGWGQIGVNLFFVLSGFLITTLLIEEREATGRIDVRAFYLRRALRLLPALAVLLIGVTLLMLVSGRAAEIPVDLLSTLFYVRNWFTAFGENPGVLSHAWSLSIEEQFYIVWPGTFLLLIVFWKGRWRGLVATLVLLALISTMLRAAIWIGGDYNRALWGTDTRLDAILIGCTLAFLRWRWGLALPWYVGIIGLTIVGLTGFMDSFSSVVIGMTIVSLAGAAVVLACLDTRLLAWRPIVAIGVVSYGLYLYHRPIARIFVDNGLVGQLTAAAAIATISLILAWLSYRYVERPALRLKSRWQRQPVSGLAGSAAVAIPSGESESRRG
jgi:peptidoglycan/LPS O-acetylase OafA/YrhL